MHGVLRWAAQGALLAAAAASAASAQVTGSFFSGVPSFTPGSGANFNPANLVCTQSLSAIDFPNATSLAGACGPASGLTGFSQSARFDGSLVAVAPGAFSIGICRDDGFAFYLNGGTVVESWGDQATCSAFAVALGAGDNPFRIDYYANSYGGSTFQVNLPTGVRFGTAQVVPEPATVALLAGGLVGVAGVARRRRHG
jgi:hypothetical protein